MTTRLARARTLLAYAPWVGCVAFWAAVVALVVAGVRG